MKKIEIVVQRSRKLIIRQGSQTRRNWARICSELLNQSIVSDGVVFASGAADSSCRWDAITRTYHFEMTRKLRLILSDSAPDRSVLSSSPLVRKPAIGVMKTRALVACMDGSTSLTSPDIRSAPVISSTAGSTRQQPGELTGEAFAALLQLLDADLERAGRQYLSLQKKLARFFEGRGCSASADLADEVLTRVGHRLAGGELIRSDNPINYFYGVARNVLREYRFHCHKESLQLEELNPGEHPLVLPDAMSERNTDQERMERLLDCLEMCLTELPVSSRELLFAYYEDHHRLRIEQRKALAERLGITPNALKIRVFRIRETLERRVSERLNPPSGR